MSQASMKMSCSCWCRLFTNLNLKLRYKPKYSMKIGVGRNNNFMSFSWSLFPVWSNRKQRYSGSEVEPFAVGNCRFLKWGIAPIMTITYSLQLSPLREVLAKHQDSRHSTPPLWWTECGSYLLLGQRAWYVYSWETSTATVTTRLTFKTQGVRGKVALS